MVSVTRLFTGIVRNAVSYTVNIHLFRTVHISAYFVQGIYV